MKEKNQLVKRKFRDLLSIFSLKASLWGVIILAGTGFVVNIMLFIASGSGGMTFVLFFFTTAIFLVLTLSGYFILQAFISPLAEITSFMATLSQGEPLKETEFPPFYGELGELMAASKEYHHKISKILMRQNEEIEALRQEEQQRAMSAGLEDEIQKQTQEELDYLKDFAGQTKTNFYKMADAIDIELQNNISYITDQASKASSIATKLTTSANFVGQRTDTVADEATQALDNVHSVEQSADSLNAAVNVINGHIRKSSELTTEAVTITNQTKETFDRMEKAATGIEEIIHLISDIAGQTNLLALNATIEAARAGDAGKGFAVVASEVKGLASQTTQSITDITEHVKGIQEIVSSAAQDMDRISQSIDSVQHSADEIMEEVERQSEATQEIANNLVQAHQSVKTVASGIAEISGEAKSNMTVAQDIHIISETLATQVSTIRDNLLDIVNNSLQENDRRSHMRFDSNVKAMVAFEGQDPLPISIIDYSRSGIQMEVKGEKSLEGFTEGSIELEEAGFGVRFKVVQMKENYIHAEYSDDQDMANMFFEYVQSKDPSTKMEESLDEVELFG